MKQLRLKSENTDQYLEHKADIICPICLMDTVWEIFAEWAGSREVDYLYCSVCDRRFPIRVQAG